jgi:hypothetical protein
MQHQKLDKGRRGAFKVEADFFNVLKNENSFRCAHKYVLK